MFGIGFPELMLIGVVALLVVGPERLPKVARTAGAWLGRLNRYVSQVKADINREMQLEELRNAQQEMKASVQKYEIMADEAVAKAGQEADEIGKSVTGALNEAESALSDHPAQAQVGEKAGDKAA